MKRPIAHDARVSTDLANGTGSMTAPSKRPLPNWLLAARLLPAAALGLSFVSLARADPRPAADVVVRDTPAPRRVFSLEFNPAALLLQRISANIEIVPVDHHGVVLSGAYFYPRTARFDHADAGGNFTIPVLSQKFEGFGGEIGYRYFTGTMGARGFFVGPSLLLASVQATSGDGVQTSFADIGVAADIGYQALLGGDWVIGIGAGVQYVITTKDIPDQQWPANLYANRGVQPRALFALGYAF